MARFFLVGYMGCGKSTLGRRLARRLGIPFVDTDTLVERHEGASVADVFHYEGGIRELVEEITQIMTYVSMDDVQLVPVEVETPLEKTVQYRIPEESVAIVPILRAGLGMVNGVHKVFPTARVGHIGMYRNEETLEPQEYYCKLPDGIENKTVILVDPMLATGGSACDALAALKKRGCKNIKMMSIIAAPEGIERVAKEHPDVRVYVSTLDRELNENGYILPGLGDAGDRLFGTK